jgi:O-antigen/teichoic acid export membrane protein
MFFLKPKRLTLWFSNSQSSRDVIVLMIGTLFSQVIPILSAPVLTRLYSPEDFGKFALFLAISSIMAVISAGRYELAIILPKKDSDAVCLLKLAVTIACLFGLILLIMVFLLHIFFSEFMSKTNLGVMLYCVPVSVCLTGVYQCFYYWNNRKKEYQFMAFNKIWQSILITGTSIFCGIVGLGGGGLVIGMLTGQLISTSLMVMKSFTNNKNILLEASRKNFKILGLRYINFPKYLAIAHLINSTSFQFPVIFLNLLFPTQTAGYFLLTRRVISAPVSLIGKSVGDVFRQKASEEFASHGQCEHIYIKTMKRLFYISFLPFLLFYFVSPSLFGTIFGHSWRIAGEYAQILTPMFFIQFLVSPLASMFVVAEKQKMNLAWQVILIIFISGAFATGYYYSSVKLALILFSGSYCFMYLINGVLTYSFAKRGY